jgi:hypothetical protein
MFSQSLQEGGQCSVASYNLRPFESSILLPE